MVGGLFLSPKDKKSKIHIGLIFAVELLQVVLPGEARIFTFHRGIDLSRFTSLDVKFHFQIPSV